MHRLWLACAAAALALFAHPQGAPAADGGCEAVRTNSTLAMMHVERYANAALSDGGPHQDIVNVARTKAGDATAVVNGMAFETACNPPARFAYYDAQAQSQLILPHADAHLEKAGLDALSAVIQHVQMLAQPPELVEPRLPWMINRLETLYRSAGVAEPAFLSQLSATLAADKTKDCTFPVLRNAVATTTPTMMTQGGQYPPNARAVVGRIDVVIGIDLSDTGAITNAFLKQPSGDPAVDEFALREAHATTFAPKLEYCVPVASSTEVHYTWGDGPAHP